MKILVDQEGRNVISQLCDIALKQGGVQNLNQVNLILRSVRLLPTLEEPTKPKSPEKKDEATGGEKDEKQEEVKEESEEEPSVGSPKLESPKEAVVEEVTEDKEG